jgi:hypothetical protein
MDASALFVPAAPLEPEAPDAPLGPDTPIATRAVVAAAARRDTIFLVSLASPKPPPRQMVALGQSFPVMQRPSQSVPSA